MEHHKLPREIWTIFLARAPQKSNGPRPIDLPAVRRFSVHKSANQLRLCMASNTYEPLDSTIVHPESYTLARRLTSDSGCILAGIGTADNIAQLATLIGRKECGKLAKENGVSEERVRSVVYALQSPLLQDFRVDVNHWPLFHVGVLSMFDLPVGSKVIGSIIDEPEFRVFHVDIGTETAGVICSKQLGGMKPNVGDRVKVKVIENLPQAPLISLKLMAIC